MAQSLCDTLLWRDCISSTHSLAAKGLNRKLCISISIRQLLSTTRAVFLLWDSAKRYHFSNITLWNRVVHCHWEGWLTFIYAFSSDLNPAVFIVTATLTQRTEWYFLAKDWKSKNRTSGYRGRPKQYVVADLVLHWIPSSFSWPWTGDRTLKSRYTRF